MNSEVLTIDFWFLTNENEIKQKSQEVNISIFNKNNSQGSTTRQNELHSPKNITQETANNPRKNTEPPPIY